MMAGVSGALLVDGITSPRRLACSISSRWLSNSATASFVNSWNSLSDSESSCSSVRSLGISSNLGGLARSMGGSCWFVEIACSVRPCLLPNADSAALAETVSPTAISTTSESLGKRTSGCLVLSANLRLSFPADVLLNRRRSIPLSKLAVFIVETLKCDMFSGLKSSSVLSSIMSITSRLV